MANDFKNGLGPLGGVLTAMKWIKQNNRHYEWISTFPSDTPFFTKKELKYFYEKIRINEGKLFFIKSEDTRHNIFGLWSLKLIDQLEAAGIVGPFEGSKARQVLISDLQSLDRHLDNE